MKIKTLLSGTVRLLIAAPGFLQAETMASFDGVGDTPFTLEQFGDPGGPEIAPGISGNSLILTKKIQWQRNSVTFDRSDIGEFPSSSFSFDFRISNTEARSADGFSFSLINTADFGTTGGLGVSPFLDGEDPAAMGVLGFGFDTHENPNAFDMITPGQAFSDYSEISIFHDGNLISRIDDTRSLPSAFALDDAEVHHASGLIDFENARVSLSIDDHLIFDNLAVPNLAPFESRVLLAGRTGALSQTVEIDNLNVQYGDLVHPIPEPSTLPLLSLLALTVMCRHRLRKPSRNRNQSLRRRCGS